jgi:heme-degrading monooxygenase HmoA
MVFINFALAKPRPGKEEQLADLMRNFRDALRIMPGNVGVYLLKEKGTRDLAGLSIWHDEASFEAAMSRMAGAPSHSPEDVREAPPVVRQFTEVQ